MVNELRLDDGDLVSVDYSGIQQQILKVLQNKNPLMFPFEKKAHLDFFPSELVNWITGPLRIFGLYTRGQKRNETRLFPFFFVRKFCKNIGHDRRTFTETKTVGTFLPIEKIR